MEREKLRRRPESAGEKMRRNERRQAARMLAKQVRIGGYHGHRPLGSKNRKTIEAEAVRMLVRCATCEQVVERFRRRYWEPEPGEQYMQLHPHQPGDFVPPEKKVYGQ